MDERLFTGGELRSSAALPLGARLIRMCISMPSIEQGTTDRRRARGFEPLNRNTFNEDGRPVNDPWLRVLTDKLSAAKSSDAKGFRASCNNAACPTCMTPDAQQPQNERYIFYHDLINWWNLSKGHCMNPQCHKKLVWGNYGAGAPRQNVWTLQREDQKLPHFVSNICSVVCHHCNVCSASHSCICRTPRRQMQG